MTARTAMTPARKERIWTACLGRCEECQEPVPQDGLGVEFDHIIPLWTATDDARRAELERDDNLQTLCPGCHAEKTRLEAPRRAKAKRLAGETCTAKPRRQLQSRGFDQRLTKGVDGKVRLRRRRTIEEPHQKLKDYVGLEAGEHSSHKPSTAPTCAKFPHPSHVGETG